MPSYVSHEWKVKKPFSELLPEVDPQGEWWGLSDGEKRKVMDFKVWREQIMEVLEGRKKDIENHSSSDLWQMKWCWSRVKMFGGLTHII